MIITLVAESAEIYSGEDGKLNLSVETDEEELFSTIEDQLLEEFLAYVDPEKLKALVED